MILIWYDILEAHPGHMLSFLTLAWSFRSLRKPGDISNFNEHRADCKITDEHPMNFGDRYCVKTQWIFKTWWKPGEISRPGENLVNAQNLAKTWWIFKTWWKPGEFSKLGENLVNFQNLVKTWWFLCCEHEEVFYRFQIHQKKCFEPTFWWKLCVFMVKMDRKSHWTKTWWKPGENLVIFQNLVKTWWIFKTRWKLGENLVKTWCKLAENLVKTWWKPGEILVKTWWKLGENLVKTWRILKTWWKLGEDLVKTWWKLGENLVKTWWIFKTWWKPGDNRVKTWWEPGQKSGRNLFENVVQPGEHFLKKPRENLVKTWWKPCEFSQPGDNLMKCHNLGKNLMEF